MDTNDVDDLQLPVVGFVGLGEQGTPIARRILDGGYPMALWARREASLSPFQGSRATIAGSLSDLAQRSDIVCICVLDDEDVDQIFSGGLLDGLRPGSLVVIHSTVQPETCRRLAVAAERRSIGLIDAPVSGMARGAAQGTMAIFVGGDAVQFERFAPIARTFGVPTHVGPLGSGQLVKLLNNMTAACNLVIAQDTLALGQEFGIDKEVLVSALLGGSAGCRFLEQFASSGFSPTFGRKPEYFLRDWERILGDFQAILSEGQVPGLLVETLGKTFLERTGHSLRNGETGS